MRYEIVIWWSAEDKVYVAEAPELPGCMAHGKTREQALAEIAEAIELWLETARELGRPIPKPKKRRALALVPA
jgi:predicted RNase H-like HicB family nuclease